MVRMRSVSPIFCFLSTSASVFCITVVLVKHEKTFTSRGKSCYAKNMLAKLHHNAFTLIELLVVIGILGILFTVGSYTLGSVSARSRNDTRKQDLKHIQTVLEQYATDQRSYPQFDTLLVSGKPILSAAWQLTDSPTCQHTTSSTGRLSPTYLHVIPEDPRQNADFTDSGHPCPTLIDNQTSRYVYISTANGASYGLLATLERETPPQYPAQIINGNLSTNAPYSYTANPLTLPTTIFGNFYSTNSINTNADANYILTGGATR